MVAFLSTALFGNFVYKVRSGPAAGMWRKGGLGFLNLGRPPSAEIQFLDRLELSGKTVYDIGGFEGILTMFFARKAARVITYEPNSRNFQRCLENIKLNRLENVQLFPRGLSSKSGELQMAYDPLMPGAASASDAITRQILGSGGGAKTMAVSVSTLDSEIETHRLPDPDFIKIDIEGMELDALKGMRGILSQRGPDLFIELHGAELEDKVQNARAVVDLLTKAGYRIHDVENAVDVTSIASHAFPPSHLYCTKGRTPAT